MLKIGAGGYVTGIAIAEDGTKVCRTDTYGAYVWEDGAWAQLCTTERLPAGVWTGLTPGNDSLLCGGVYSIAIAPSDSDVIYMVYGGDLYKSVDKGLTFAATGFTHRTNLEPNDSYRYCGQKMAVDPADPNHVLVGTVSNGLFRSTDGGTNFSATGVTAGSLGGHCGIAFDPTSGTTGGRTNVIYAGSWGNGVWRSADAGANWTQISAAITQVMHGKVGNTSGVYYCTASLSTGSIHKYGGSWTTISSSQFAATVVVDRTDNNKLYAVRDSGHIETSTNAGASWNGITWTMTTDGTDIPWLGNCGDTYLSVGDVVQDPITTSRVWLSAGIGVWRCDAPGSATSIDWVSASAGIEQLVAHWIWSVPGGALYLTAWDRPLWKVTDPDTYPSDYLPNYDNQIVKGYSLEHATDDAAFLVLCAGYWAVEESAYSTNGGASWTSFARPVSGGASGGHIAVSTTDNWVWQMHSAQPVYYTTNRGTNWTKITLPSPFVDDTSGDGWGGFSATYNLERHVVCADRVTAGTFYLYHNVHGIFRSTNGGATWTRGRTTPLNTIGYDYWNGKLRAVPGQAGHLFWTCGAAGGGNPALGAGFWRSTNGGDTFSQVSNVLEVYDYDFGKEKPGESYPAVFIVGFVSSEYGVWRSDDNCATWTKIGDYPISSLDYIRCVGGDLNTYGRCYVGFNGSGWAYYG